MKRMDCNVHSKTVSTCLLIHSNIYSYYYWGQKHRNQNCTSGSALLCYGVQCRTPNNSLFSSRQQS